MTSFLRPAASVLALLLVAAACGGTTSIDNRSMAPAATAVAEPAASAAPAPTATAPTVTSPTVTPPIVTSPTVTAPTVVAGQPPAAEPLGRIRYCTVDVESDEVLNVRDQPSLEGTVIARVPGRSCSLTVSDADSADAEWLSVSYETAHVHHTGYVSSTFVAPATLDEHAPIALAWVQAILDDTDRSALEYSAHDVALIEGFRGPGARAVPFVDSRNLFCSLEGDVTVECPIVVRGPDPTVSLSITVFVQQLGTNGYGDEFFPDDFGDEPLVVGFDEARQDACDTVGDCYGTRRTTIAIDSRANLAGVEIGAPTEYAIERLTARFGQPDRDTGWVVGCPLDSEVDLNERYVEWGPLQVAFGKWEQPEGELQYWYYNFGEAASDATADQSQRPPLPFEIRLPGGLAGETSLDQVSQATRLPIETHELLDSPVIFGPGWTLYGESESPDNQLTIAAVPYVGICD